MSRQAPKRSRRGKATAHATTRRQAVAAGLSILCLAVLPREAAAANVHDDGLPDEVIMLAGALSDSELDGYRGGFDLGGYIIDFGVTVRTLVDGMHELVSNLNLGERVGDRIPTNVTSALNNLANGQSVVVNSIDESTRVVEAVLGNTKVAYDYRNGILTTISNPSSNTTVSSSVVMNVGIANYQSVLQAAQIRAMASAAAVSIRNASLRR